MVMRRAGSARPEAISADRTAFAGFRYGLVGQADNGKGGQARRDLHLNIDGPCLDAFESHRGNMLDHQSSAKAMFARKGKFRTALSEL
jgi:hypothetical protein